MGIPATPLKLLTLAAAMAAFIACGGHPASDEPANPAAPSVSGGQATASTPRDGVDDPVPSPSPGVSPSPSASPSPGVSPSPPVSPAPSCPYGKGTLETTCDRIAPVFLGDVDAAINKVVTEHPEWFDLKSDAGPGAYRVLDPEQYVAAVMTNVQALGFCAAYDGTVVQLKNSNDFSESYDILLSTGYIRRGAGSYRSTCSPAAFPIDPADYVKSIRVAFFGFKCDEGITPPRNGAGELPMGCDGFVTATPKDKNNADVPASVHGPNITWTLDQAAKFVRLEHVEGQPFNQTVVPVAPGDFRLCATVLGVEGCLNGRVIVPEQ